MRIPVLARVAMIALSASLFFFPGWNTAVAAEFPGAEAATRPDHRHFGTAESPQQRGERGDFNPNVYKTRIRPNWFDDNRHFWYRNDLARGSRQFVLVNAVEGVRSPAFDHERLAKALSESTGEQIRADRLPLDRLAFDLADNVLSFQAGGKTWRCDLETYELAEADDARNAGDAGGLPPLPLRDAPRASTRTGAETAVTFVNRTDGEVELFWLDASGDRRSYGKVAAGERHEQHTYTGHVWEIVDSAGRTVALFQARQTPAEARIAVREGDPPRRREDTGPRSGPRPRARSQPRGTSPDGKWAAFVRDNNVWIRSRKDDGEEVQLSRDGVAELSYEMLEWSPDSKALVAFRIEPGERKEVHLLESSPRGGGRARVHTRPYALPGDKFTAYELSLFNIETKQRIKPDVDRIDFGRPRLRWNDAGRRFTYEKIDRGHQRFRLIEVDARTGDVRHIIDEQTDTFIWTAHGPSLRMVNWLDRTDEIIYVSERDGWRHLYLIDAAAEPASQQPALKQITKGDWVVRGIDRIDEEKRQVWFRASGMNRDQDPYLIHFYRINFDGTGLVALTEGDGNHDIAYSPDRKYLIDTYSRVDMAPVHELRRLSDGELMCELERADTSELKRSGWRAPEVFSAKGRDGKTDIWGIICRPRDFDPEKKYPIIEDIYAGPHGSFVPKSFSTRDRYRSLTDLGFIVVKIDGMGTANRSKAFHDVCWRNLKDAGLEDRILWMKAAAKKYPSMDIDRVGIYGTSAGGQNAAAAVLFHPEFYKAAVANCGCHDNRMDKASWNEQWMGYPVGTWYAESSNIDNAHRLQGALFLIVGEMDTNVPPESTYRFVDALIKADKDFDFLMVPGGGHGAGGAYGRRRMHDFFVRHLLDRNPPSRNAPRGERGNRAPGSG